MLSPSSYGIVTMSQTIAAGLYIIKRDEEGNMMIFLPQPEGEKDHPLIMYDGGKHALLVRNKSQNVILDCIADSLKQELLNAEKAWVVEIFGNEIVDSYECGLRRVDKIPADWSKYGLPNGE